VDTAIPGVKPYPDFCIKFYVRQCRKGRGIATSNARRSEEKASSKMGRQQKEGRKGLKTEGCICRVRGTVRMAGSRDRAVSGKNRGGSKKNGGVVEVGIQGERGQECQKKAYPCGPQKGVNSAKREERRTKSKDIAD